MSEIQSRRVLDEEADFSTLPNQDPRISTFIQRQADDYEEKSGASEEDYPCSEKNILLSRTKARVFADPVAVVDAIMGGDPFRTVRSFVAFEDLLEEEGPEDGTASKIIQAIMKVEGVLYEFILLLKKKPLKNGQKYRNTNLGKDIWLEQC